MNIFTERLILRTFKLKDANQFFNIIQDDAVKYYLKGVYEDNKEKVKATIAIYRGADFVNDYYYAIEDKKNGDLLGSIIATRINKHEIEVAYFIAEQYRRCRFMKEALMAFLKQITDERKNKILKFVVDKENVASINLIKSLNIPIYGKSDSQYIFKYYGGVYYDN